MLEYVLLGGGFAFAAAIQPGPLQAFLLWRVAATGWRRTLPACLAPLLSDGPIIVVSLLVLGRLPLPVQHALRAGGGLFLIYLAWVAFRQWRTPAEAGAQASAPRTLFQAVIVNLLNPNPYVAWTLVLGPAVLAAWRERAAFAVALVVAFYVTMVVGLAAFILLAGSARFLGARGQRALVGVSAVILAVLGLYLVTSALRSLGAG